MTNILGHKKQIEFLNRAFENKVLAHAYIFAGPEGVGKKTVANYLAQKMLADKTVPSPSPEMGEGKSENFISPDFISVSSEGEIGISQIRELTYKLSLKPYFAQYKIAVIDNAENMTLEASNALLKTLEEPKPSILIILITANPYRIPRTIFSRVQKINFGPIEKNELIQALPKNLSDEGKNFIYELSCGRVGMAMNLAKDANFLEEIKNYRQYYGDFVGNDEVKRLLLVPAIAELETPKIKELLDYWLIKLKSDLIVNPTIKLANKIKAVLAAFAMLEQNINTKLWLTNLMLE